MMRRMRGFTVVELLVVIVIIGILVTVVSLQASRGRLVGRDKERENDVKIITDYLENIYKNGQADGVMIPNGGSSATPLGYPSTALISDPSNAQTKAILGGMDPDSLKSPLKGSMSLVVASSETGVSGNTAGGKTIDATSANDVYVYQPLANGNVICTSANVSQPVISPRLTDACVKFVIYYFSETSNAIKSKASLNSSNNGL